MKRSRALTQEYNEVPVDRGDVVHEAAVQVAHRDILAYLTGGLEIVPIGGARKWDVVFEKLAHENIQWNEFMLARVVYLLQDNYQEFLDIFTIELFSNYQFDLLDIMIRMNWRPSSDFELNARVNLFSTLEDLRDIVGAQKMISWLFHHRLVTSDKFGEIERPTEI